MPEICGWCYHAPRVISERLQGRWVLTTTLTAALIGALACTVGPDYEPPVPVVPDAWKTAVSDEITTEDSPLQSWFIGFDDPQLEHYIQRAIAANRNLATAAARVSEARALLGVTSGGLYPDLALDGSYSRNEVGANGVQPGPEDAFSIYHLGVTASWEIDVFGRIRRSVEAAGAGLDASIEDYRDVLVILMADVASTYLTVRTIQARLDYARANVEAQSDSVQLTRDRFDAGLTSARDVAQAESNLANSQAAIPLLETTLEQALNRLSILIGEAPGAVDDDLAAVRPVPEVDETITIGIPAELLRRRPDVRRAERLLASQTALVGAATADLYPTFSLSGVVALESTDSGTLFESDSVGWSLVPGLRWNLFSAGKIRNRIRVEEARTEQALHQYEQTVLSALGEVEDALVAFEREKVRRDHLRQAVDATVRTVKLVRTQYLSGLTDFQSFLDAQRSLFNQQDQLASAEGQVVQNLIALNLALGGGWDVAASATTTAEAESLLVQEPSEQGSEG